MVKRMFPLMESDGNSGMTPGGDLMREVEWCENALAGRPQVSVAEAKGGYGFDFSEGTRPVVENLIEALEDQLQQAKDNLDPASLEAAEKAYKSDLALLKGIVRKLSVV